MRLCAFKYFFEFFLYRLKDVFTEKKEVSMREKLLFHLKKLSRIDNLCVCRVESRSYINEIHPKVSIYFLSFNKTVLRFIIAHSLSPLGSTSSNPREHKAPSPILFYYRNTIPFLVSLLLLAFLFFSVRFSSSAMSLIRSV